MSEGHRSRAALRGAHFILLRAMNDGPAAFEVERRGETHEDREILHPEAGRGGSQPHLLAGDRRLRSGTRGAAAVLTRITRFLALAAVAGGFAATAARAEAPAPAVLILDSSGSMAGRVPDGRTKLDAARAIVATALETWPAGAGLAVIAYGHRRQADCSDIETLREMGPVSPGAIGATLAPLRARGKTPIAQSLRRAAALLPAGGGSIVLVSDGLETCSADPCAVAGDLKKANATLAIHVVGFGLKPGEAAQLTCIAENAGGRFFDVGDADGLAAALNSVTATIAAEPPEPAPAPAPEPPPPPPRAELPPPVPEPPPAPIPESPALVRVGLVAVAGGLGRIVDAPVRWTVGDEAGRGVFEGESRGLFLDLPAGAYRVAAAAANARGQAAITVGSGPGQTFEIEVPAGQLDLSLAASPGAAPFDDLQAAGVVWTLEPQDGQDGLAVPPLARPSLLLAPGRYGVRARLRELEGEAVADVRPGAPVSVALDFRLGTLVLEAVLDGEDEAITDATAIRWRLGEGEAAQVFAGEARPRLALREGTYPIVLRIAGSDLPATAEVRAGEERVARVVVGGGELLLSARLGPQSPPLEDWRDTYWQVTAAGGPAGAKTVALQEAAPTVPLPPGTWRVTLLSGAVTMEREVTVAPGSRTPVVVTLAGARLSVSAGPASGERAANIVFSVIALGEDGAPAARPAFETGSNEAMSTIVPAGRWRIVANDSDGRHGETDIRLGVGEERAVDLALE